MTNLPTTSSPLDGLISTAIEKGGTDVAEVVERLLAAKYRDEDRAKEEAFNRAFHAFWKECPEVKKTKRAGDATAGGSAQTWTYAPLDEIQATVRPVLLKHGLSYRWSNDEVLGELVVVTCTISHEEGHSERTRISISKPKGNRLMTPEKRDGAALAYAQRLCLLMALGIVTEGTPDTNVPPPEPIDQKQASAIDEYLAQLGDAARAQFLEVYGIDSHEHLPAHKYPGAIKQLEIRAAK